MGDETDSSFLQIAALSKLATIHELQGDVSLAADLTKRVLSLQNEQQGDQKARGELQVKLALRHAKVAGSFAVWAEEDPV